MKSIFTFRCPSLKEKEFEDLIVFLPERSEHNSIIKTIKDEEDRSPIHGQIYVLVCEKFVTELLAIIETGSFIQEIENLGITNSVELIKVNSSGIFFDKNDQYLSNEIKQKILESGANFLFKKRKGLITSTDNYHFKKPSGDHCNQFIRASNLLVYSSEVHFLAIGLLPYIDDSVERIYVDTSSISYLVSTALKLKGMDDVLIAQFQVTTAICKLCCK